MARTTPTRCLVYNVRSHLIVGAAFVAASIGCGGRVADAESTGSQASGGTEGRVGASSTGSQASGGTEGRVGASSIPVGATGGTPSAANGGATQAGSADSTGGNSNQAVVYCPDNRWVAVTGPACGDGLLAGSAGCDDGNVVSGDGCDSRCRVERAWVCWVAGQPCTLCGNCQLDDGEQCDDGPPDDGDGCSHDCQLEPEWVCGSPQQACVFSGHCGDGWVGPFREVCDDGNDVGGDGCSADCTTVEVGFVCQRAGQPCIQVSRVYPQCGDGITQWDIGEECDNASLNGQQSGCTIECRLPRCGDGQIQTELEESCDDGIMDGSWNKCNTDCDLFVGSSSYCSLLFAWCGDSFVNGPEACDHGALNGLDGQCSTDCTFSRPGYCSDGALDELYEECDDGNLTNCDGCSANCQVETDAAPPPQS